MSQSKELVASLSQLEKLFVLNEEELKRDIELRFGSLRAELNRVKSSLDQNNLLALLIKQEEYNRHELSDLPNPYILSTSTGTTAVTSNKQTSTRDLVEANLNSTEIGNIETLNSFEGNALDTEVNDSDTNVPSTLTANNVNHNESTSENEQVNQYTPNLSSVTITNDVDNDDQSETLLQKSSDGDASKIQWDIKVNFKDEDKYHQIEGGEVLDNKQNESLHESNETNQCNDNPNHIDLQVDDQELSEPISTIIEGHNESKTRKRTRKSLATKIVSLDNSLTSSEMSMPGLMTRSKRKRVTCPVGRREITEQVSPGPRLDLVEDEHSNGIDSSGGGDESLEQSENEDSLGDIGTELEEERGNYKMEVLAMQCTEEDCEFVVTNRVELHDHLRNEHITSLPYRCLARGCGERFEKWGALGNHVFCNHWDIPTWPCSHCIKTFKTHARLYKHLYYYHYEGQFKCGYVGCHYDKVALFRSEIQTHQLLSHPKTTNYICQIKTCAKSFNQKSHYKIHLRMHQGIKPFKCTWNMCDHASTSKNSTIRHIRMQHFNLPPTKTKQHELGIESNRNPLDYLRTTTDQ